jgi:Mrp family chromosome partitioning ATPase
MAECIHTVELPSGDDGVTEASGAPGSLRVLTSGPLPPNPGEIASSQRLAEFLALLAKEADLVLVDAPPFLVVGDAGALSRAVDGVVDVVRLGKLTRTIAHDSCQVLATLPCRVLGVAVVAVPTEGASYRYKYYRDKSQAIVDAEAEPAAAAPGQPA